MSLLPARNISPLPKIPLVGCKNWIRVIDGGANSQRVPAASTHRLFYTSLQEFCICVIFARRVPAASTHQLQEFCIRVIFARRQGCS